MDNTPTASSTNLVSSGGVYSAIKKPSYFCKTETAADTATKVITISDDTFSLEVGVVLDVEFIYGNTSTSSIFLNVNGTSKILIVDSTSASVVSAKLGTIKPHQVVRVVYGIGNSETDLRWFTTSLNKATTDYYGIVKLSDTPGSDQDLAATPYLVQQATSGLYTKPSGGIPASDLASGVIPDVSGCEVTSNKVTSLSSSSTDTQYPSALCVYNLVGDIETLLAAL